MTAFVWTLVDHFFVMFILFLSNIPLFFTSTETAIKVTHNLTMIDLSLICSCKPFTNKYFSIVSMSWLCESYRPRAERVLFPRLAPKLWIAFSNAELSPDSGNGRLVCSRWCESGEIDVWSMAPSFIFCIQNYTAWVNIVKATHVVN